MRERKTGFFVRIGEKSRPGLSDITICPLMPSYAERAQKKITENCKKRLTRLEAHDIISHVRGALAQLVARLNGIQKVRGSTPLCSTKLQSKG